MLLLCLNGEAKAKHVQITDSSGSGREVRAQAQLQTTADTENHELLQPRVLRELGPSRKIQT